MDEIQNMEDFFNLDLKIKQTLISMVPYKLEDADYARMKYVDRLLESLEFIKEAYNKMLSIAKLDTYKEKILNKFNNYEEEIISCNYEIDKLQKCYEKNISSMTTGLDKSLEDNIQGYLLEKEYDKPLKKCNTVNDILHFIHFSYMNNDDIYNRVPIIEERKSSNNYIILRGLKNEDAMNLYNAIPDTVESYPMDICSLNN